MKEGDKIYYREYGSATKSYIEATFIKFGSSYCHLHKGIEECIIVLVYGTIFAFPISCYDIKTEKPLN